MTVVAFPKRLPPHALERLSRYDQVAHAKGIQTMTITAELAAQAAMERTRAIIEMPELQVFGRLNNELSLHFAFATRLSVEEVQAETIAIRKALARIGIAGMAIDEIQEPTHE